MRGVLMDGILMWWTFEVFAMAPMGPLTFVLRCLTCRFGVLGGSSWVGFLGRVDGMQF